MDYAEIVDADVRELRTTCDLADRPHTRRCRLQPLVDLDVSPLGELDSRRVQAECFRGRVAACGDQNMSTLQDFLSSILLDDDSSRVSRFSGHAFDTRIQVNIDA